MQYLVGHFLVLLLVGVAGALDEEQAVMGGGGHVRVDVAQEAGGVAVGEVIIGADEQGTGVGDLRDLREVAVGRGVNIIEQAAVYPVIGGGDGTLHPAHQQEGQHLGGMATVVELADEFALAGRDAGGHVVEVGGREQQEVLYARDSRTLFAYPQPFVVAREVVDDLVGAQRVTGQDDVAVALPGGIVEVGLDVLVGQSETLVPRADDFLAARVGVHRSDGSAGVVGLGVDEVKSYKLCNLKSSTNHSAFARSGTTRRLTSRQTDDRLIEKQECYGYPLRVEYRLTEHGKRLYAIVYKMTKWGMEHRALILG